MILSFCLLQLVESPTLPDPNNLFKWHMKLRGFDDSCSGAQVEHSVACLLSALHSQLPTLHVPGLSMRRSCVHAL